MSVSISIEQTVSNKLYAPSVLDKLNLSALIWTISVGPSPKCSTHPKNEP